MSFRAALRGVLVLTVAAGCGGKEEEALPDAAIPTNGTAPNQRALITYLDPSSTITTFRGHGAEVPPPFPANVSLFHDSGAVTTPAGAMSAGSVFSIAQAAGVALDALIPVPVDVICSSYLTRSDTDQRNNTLYLAFTERDLRTNQMQRSTPVSLAAPAPAYRYTFNADLLPLDAPTLDRRVAHDILPWDFDGDGYTDYVVSYVTNIDPGWGWWGDNIRVALVLVDGRSLYQASHGAGTTVKLWADTSIVFTTGYDVVGGWTDAWEGLSPPNSVRTAIGDMDGDGKPELAVYLTQVNGGSGGPHDNNLHLLSLRYDGLKAPKFTWLAHQMNNDGTWAFQSNSVAVAMGDLDGDHKAELAVLYGDRGVVKNESGDDVIDYVDLFFLDVYKLDASHGLRKVVDSANGTTTTPIKGVSEIVAVGPGEPIGLAAKVDWFQGYGEVGTRTFSRPSMQAFIADLDGDGIGELVWIGRGQAAVDTLQMGVHKWSPDPSGTKLAGSGVRYVYQLDWSLQPDDRASLAGGHFIHDDLAHPNQIGLVARTPPSDGTSGKGKASLRWGVLEWDAASGLQAVADGTETNAALAGNVGPIIVPSSFDPDTCPAGTAWSFAGMCGPCSAGTAALAGVYACTPCSADTYAPASRLSVCTACTEGSRAGVGASACTVCAVGTYWSAAAGACVPCAAGSFGPTAGLTSCAPCLAGTFAATSGSSTCPSCLPGTSSAAGATSCTACTAGSSYTSTPGAAVCSPCSASCGAGRYVSALCDPTADTGCASCDVSCATCSGPGATRCITCSSGYCYSLTTFQCVSNVNPSSCD